MHKQALLATNGTQSQVGTQGKQTFNLVSYGLCTNMMSTLYQYIIIIVII